MRTRLLIVLLFVFLLQCTSFTAFAGEQKPIKTPDVLDSGLDYLLSLNLPDGSDSGNAFDPDKIKDIIDFVAAPENGSTVFHAGKRNGISSAYYQFDIHADLKHILEYVYNQDIPGEVFVPASLRLASWKEIDGADKNLPRFWGLLSRLEQPVVGRGIQHVENTPDLFTGAYYAYDQNRMLILFKQNGRNIFISLSKQIGISDVGRKGLVIEPDENWNYFYSGIKGLTRGCLGWVDSYMYDSFSVSIFYEPDAAIPLVRCGVFKWLKAGWSNINVVKTTHIYKGLVRFSGSLRETIENPFLPSPDKLAETFSGFNKMPADELRKEIAFYFDEFKKQCGNDKNFSGRKKFIELIGSESYLDQMSPKEMRATLALEYMKSILHKKSILAFHNGQVP